MKMIFSRTGLFALFLIMVFYCYGAGMIDYFGVYETWKLIDAKDFTAVHHFQGDRIVALFVIPSAVMTLLNILVLIFPPRYVDRRTLLFALIAYIFDWIFSFTMQIPIQLKLSEQKNMELIDELLRTNWWRFAADTVQFLIVCKLLHGLLKKLNQNPNPQTP
jgi:hypothetical protein